MKNSPWKVEKNVGKDWNCKSFKITIETRIDSWQIWGLCNFIRNSFAFRGASSLPSELQHTAGDSARIVFPEKPVIDPNPLIFLYIIFTFSNGEAYFYRANFPLKRRFVVRWTCCDAATACFRTRAFLRKYRNYAAFGRRPFANCSYVRLFSALARRVRYTMRRRASLNLQTLRDVETAIFESENDTRQMLDWRSEDPPPSPLPCLRRAVKGV